MGINHVRVILSGCRLSRFVPRNREFVKTPRVLKKKYTNRLRIVPRINHGMKTIKNAKDPNMLNRNSESMNRKIIINKWNRFLHLLQRNQNVLYIIFFRYSWNISACGQLCSRVTKSRECWQLVYLQLVSELRIRYVCLWQSNIKWNTVQTGKERKRGKQSVLARMKESKENK